MSPPFNVCLQLLIQEMKQLDEEDEVAQPPLQDHFKPRQLIEKMEEREKKKV